MRIAPIDIAHKTFSRKMMGLDGEEVTDFLRDVADQMEEIIRERNSLKEALREKEMQIMEYKERDDTLKTTITTATKMSEQIRIDAEREAKLIVNDAQQKGEMIVKDARDSLKRIYQEIGDMKRSRMQFETTMRSLVQAHLSMLDQAHTLMPDPHYNRPPQNQAPLQNDFAMRTGGIMGDLNVGNLNAPQMPQREPSPRAPTSGLTTEATQSRNHAPPNPGLQRPLTPPKN